MKIHRFITEYSVQNNQIEVVDSGLIHQWKNVLKFKIGEQLILSTSEGKEALCEITDVDKKEVVLRVISENQNTTEETLHKNVTLYLAILKKENFEFVAQKATELGVTTIVPVKTERTIKQNLNFERLEKIVKEASEQCGRSTIPKITEIMDFAEAIESLDKNYTNILFDMSGKPFSMGVGPLKLGVQPLTIFIGPEGGFAEKEINMAKESGMEITSISPLTLRGETAAIIAVYIGTNL